MNCLPHVALGSESVPHRQSDFEANFYSEMKLIFTATAQEHLARHPNEFDHNSHLDIAEARLVEYVKNRNKILLAAGKASP
jgi:fructose/tagatose bisphosphate aldolase